MMDDLTPLNLAPYDPPVWYDITPDEIDKRSLRPLKAKGNLQGRYQAGIQIHPSRWRWSIATYATSSEAEQAAREKINELAKG